MIPRSSLLHIGCRISTRRFLLLCINSSRAAQCESFVLLLLQPTSMWLQDTLKILRRYPVFCCIVCCQHLSCTRLPVPILCGFRLKQNCSNTLWNANLLPWLVRSNAMDDLSMKMQMEMGVHTPLCLKFL